MIIVHLDDLQCHIHPFVLPVCTLEVCQLVAGVKHYVRSNSSGKKKKKPCQNIGNKQRGGKHTHCNPVYLRHISECIVSIKSLPHDPQGGMDGAVIPGIECISGKTLVDMIHGQDHGG